MTPAMIFVRVDCGKTFSVGKGRHARHVERALRAAGWRARDCFEMRIQPEVIVGIYFTETQQAIGGHLDGRSDLFTVGLIFYEPLTGKVPYKADTAVASLLKRNQERALPVSGLDPSIPKIVSDIVSKCLERDLNSRYQSAQEILADLDAWRGNRPVAASVTMSAPVTPAPVPKRALP
jgi:serine/threonine protein kinase